MDLLAIAIALAAAVCFAGSFVAEQHVAAAVPEDQARGLRLFGRLARSPLWCAGACGDAVGFALQAVALAFGSVVLVQPVLVTAMVFALPLAAWWNGRRIARADLVWALVVVAGLAVFTVVGDSSKGSVSDAAGPWLWPGLAFGSACLGLWLAGRVARGPAKALALGALAGVVYGIIAPLTELTVAHFGQVGVFGLFRSWPLYALIVCLLAGTAWQQAAFHAGDLGSSLPATQVLEPVVAVALGLWALGARLETRGLAGWVALGLAGLAMILGTVQLARRAASPA
ncbi:MAG: DMT family transporter [Bifidobacteriaceae bacterium]|jgi:drug/metabolite transporter (DMT)-like permease|nr:DMT family transporter [Bifidobacteriaceae bacterium]